MAEKGQQHTIDMDRTAIAAEIDDRTRGMRYGLAVFLALIAAGLIVGLKTESVGLTAVFLGSRLIEFHSQNKTVAASMIAEKKVSGQRSYRVATRRQSFRRPNMISMRLRRL